MASLDDRIKRLERAAEEEMIEIRQADGAVKRVHLWELVAEWQKEMESRAGEEERWRA